MDLRTLEIAEPARRALRDRRPGTVSGVFEHSVTVRFGDTLVNLSDRPVTLASSARIAPGDLRTARSLPVGAPVRLHADGAVTVATRLRAAGIPRAFDPASGASWFDTATGRRVGRPRLDAAAASLAENSGPEALLALCGLGIGLTPSGDDALVGMIACARAADVGRRTLTAFAGALTPDLTTEVSLTYLRLALAGDVSVPVGRLLDALTTPTASVDAVQRAVREVARIGHTSGADLLAGVDALVRRLRAPALPHPAGPTRPVDTEEQR